MQRGDDRHVQAAQELQNMRAGRSAKNSVFVLQANQIDVAEIQEVRSLAVRRQLILRKLESYSGPDSCSPLAYRLLATPAVPWHRIQHESRHTSPL